MQGRIMDPPFCFIQTAIVYWASRLEASLERHGLRI